MKLYFYNIITKQSTDENIIAFMCYDRVVMIAPLSAQHYCKLGMYLNSRGDRISTYC